jgi:hypothetical protein
VQTVEAAEAVVAEAADVVAQAQEAAENGVMIISLEKHFGIVVMAVGSSSKEATQMFAGSNRSGIVLS